MIRAMTASYFTGVDDIAPDEAMVYAAPLSHGAGMFSFPAMLRGARHVIPESGSFDVAELAALAQSLGKVSLFAAPTMVKRLVEMHGGAISVHSDGEGTGSEFRAELLHSEEELETAMRTLSYLGMAYVWGEPEAPSALPARLAVPWHQVAAALGREPILSYASYALWNWRRIDESGPIALGNIALLQDRKSVV